MTHELIDETRGPGVPASSKLALQEIWAALGYDDGRTPTLDEVLIEIRDLRDRDPEPAEDPVMEYTPQPTVSYGPMGMTIMGYSADDVLRIRDHALASRAEKKP